MLRWMFQHGKADDWLYGRVAVARCALIQPRLLAVHMEVPQRRVSRERSVPALQNNGRGVWGGVNKSVFKCQTICCKEEGHLLTE